MIGAINGRNIWMTDLSSVLDWLDPVVSKQLGARPWVAPSCSLLHVPVDLEQKQALESGWLA